jgi:Tfp pilus assembly protein FimT
MIIAVPSLWRSRDDYVLNGAARQVAARMHLTRIEAVRRNRDCRLRVTSDVSYAIECEEFGWIPVEHFLTPQGVQIAANNRPEFHKRGNVAPTAAITLFNRTGRQKRVIVNNAGRIRIQ